MVNQFFHDTILVIQHLRQPGSVRIRVSAGLRYVKPENMVSVKLALYVWYSIHWIQLFKIGIPFLKLTARTWKWMVGRWNFLLGWPIFRGELLVSGRAIVAYNWNFCQFCLHFLFGSLVSTQNVSITVKCGPVAWYQSVLGFRSWLWHQVLELVLMEKSTKSWAIWIGIHNLQGTITDAPQKFPKYLAFLKMIFIFSQGGICWSFPEGYRWMFYFFLTVFSVRFDNACFLLRLLRMILAHIGTWHTHSMHTHNTVDGRNPAPPGTYKTL